MPSKKIVEEFVKAVETIPHDEVIEKYYTDNASMQENQSKPRVGKTRLVAYEQQVLANAKSVTSKCILPFFIKEDKVIIRWKFRFEWKNNTYSEIEEIAYQTWANEQIKQEHFFYDPQQFIPRRIKTTL